MKYLVSFVCLLFCISRGEIVEDCLESSFAQYASHFDLFFTAARAQVLFTDTMWNILDELGCYDRRPPSSCNEAAINLTIAYGCQYTQKSVWPNSFGELEGILYSYIARTNDANLKASAKRIGERVAQRVIRSKAKDGAFGFSEYQVTGGDGRWVPTPLFPTLSVSMLKHWRDMEPLAIDNAGQFNVPPPPSTSSQLFYNSAAETFLIGSKNSSVRTASQSQAAFLHDGAGGSETNTGLWMRMALAVSKQLGYSTTKIAVVARLVSYAIHDSLISNIYWKNVYDAIRPVSVYTRTGTVSNPSLPLDLNWQPYLYYPSNQEYPGGHSTGSAATAQMVKLLTGRNNVTYTLSSSLIFQGGVHPLLGPVPVIAPRTYTTIDEFVQEASNARIWAGIHFRHSNNAGEQNGAAVATFIFNSLCSNRRCMQ